MTKSELRRARKEAHAAGRPLVGALALPSRKPTLVACLDELTGAPQEVQTAMLQLVRGIRRKAARRTATRAEQHARYLDSGPRNWDDC